MIRTIRTIAATAVIVCACAGSNAWAAGIFQINLVPDAGLSANPAALAAFQRAANDWQAWIDSPITVTINAGLATLDPGVLGSTDAQFLDGGYSNVRTQMMAHATGDPSKSFISTLPATLDFTNVRLPTGYTVDPNVLVSKANAKALGFTGIDETFGLSDATVTFSNTYPFYYDRANPVVGAYDFESIAAHEIGHVLGFSSSVDDIDSAISQGITGSVELSVLDLFRFQNVVGSVPTDDATFGSNARSLIPGEDEVFSDGTHTYRMSTGTTQGDGHQASHWKDDGGNINNYIGLMDPTIASATTELITSADLQAMNALGYSIVPEPSGVVLFACGAGMFSLLVWRKKRARR